jgi:prevent-host-death family protein
VKTVGSRELKSRLGRYRSLVEKGQAILVTDRGKPVAELVPTQDDVHKKRDLDGKLKELAAAGQLRLGARPFVRFKPVRTKGKAASRLILEGRR